VPAVNSDIIRIMRKIHRWGGLLLAAFIIFYCVTGILLNHRKYFDYFFTRNETVYEVPVSDIHSITAFVDYYKEQIGRSDDPAVIRIREGRTVEFLYGSHGKTTYVINPQEGLMKKIEKSPHQPLFWLNNLHKAFQTGTSWLLLTDTVSVIIIVATITGLIVLKYRLLDFIMVFGGVLIFMIGALLSK